MYDINKSEYRLMYTAHYINRPLNIDAATQSSTIDSPLGDQKFPLISHTAQILYNQGSSPHG